MPVIPALTTFTASTRIKAAEVNSNFSSVRTQVNTYGVFIDVAASISAVYTFNTAPVFATPQAFADAVTVSSGGLTVTAGGLTVTAGGAAITGLAAVTGNATVSGTLGVSGAVTGASFTGSGSGLTNIPAANLTGTLPGISGANLTSLNGSNIASGTVSASYLPTSYTALTITTATATTAVVTTLQGAAASPRNKLNMGDSANYFAEITSASQFYFAGTGAANVFEAPIANGFSGPAGLPTVGGCRWLKCLIGGSDYFIPAIAFGP